MRTDELTAALTTLFGELVDGAPSTGAYVLNRGDPGLLSSLDRISATEASARPDSGASVAAHVEHLRYGLSLMNRWAAGENPFADADWEASWEKNEVSESEWRALRDELRRETMQWLATLGSPREVNGVELNGMIGSIAHLAYHFGAIRQVDRRLRGPAAND